MRVFCPVYGVMSTIYKVIRRLAVYQYISDILAKRVRKNAPSRVAKGLTEGATGGSEL